MEKYELLDLIGEGAYGKVHLIREISTQDFYCVKTLDKNFLNENHEMESALTECRILKRISHPFLIHLKESIETEKSFHFLMEFANGGDLYLHLSKIKKFPENTAKFYTAEIILAIGYLHSLNIIYRDLKLENLLLDVDGHIKIVDFGLSLEGPIRSNRLCGTPEYLAPEVITHNEYTRAVDWWALGVILYEMLCGCCPFRHAARENLFIRIRFQNLIFPLCVSGNAEKLMKALMEKKPERRLGSDVMDAKSVMRHPFFEGLDFCDLLEKKIETPFKPKPWIELN